MVLSSAAVADIGLSWRRGRTPAADSVAEQLNQPMHDEAVRLVAYQEARAEQAQFDSGPTGQVKFRSISVRRFNPPNVVRSAQLPTNGDEPLFGDEREPSFDDFPEADSFALPEEEESLLSEPDLRPVDREPPTYRQPEVESGPATDPFTSEEDIRPRIQPDTRLPADMADDTRELEDEHRKTQDLCSQELADLKASRLSDLDLVISVAGTEGEDYPFECSIDDGTAYVGRCWPQTTYMWKASALCHKPLYFENEQLERYGHSWGPCVQPIVSGAHFFSTLPILPYCMGIDPPCECVYALGHYRPGNCAPYMCYPVPITCRAAAFQAGAVVGAAAVLP